LKKKTWRKRVVPLQQRNSIIKAVISKRKKIISIFFKESEELKEGIIF
jgi:hypothetical protein